MGSAIYVSNDGNWGSAEEGDLVILHKAKDADIENIDENTDSGRWEVALGLLAKEQKKNKKKITITVTQSVYDEMTDILHEYASTKVANAVIDSAVGSSY